jgi:hypothetical protein
MPESDLDDFITGDSEFFNNAAPTVGEGPSVALALPLFVEKLSTLLPVASIQLTKEEEAEVKVYQEARVVLGAAGAAPMVCDAKCPIAARCPLAGMNKAPAGKLCPFEANYILQRFTKWCEELDVTSETMLESERVTISNLTYLDLQEQRCLSILADAKNANLQSRSVRDVDAGSGQVICWEDVIHINMQALAQIQTQRRMLMKDFELTPETKTKKNRWEMKKNGNDLSSRGADNADKLRRALRKQPTVVDVTPVA